MSRNICAIVSNFNHFASAGVFFWTGRADLGIWDRMPRFVQTTRYIPHQEKRQILADSVLNTRASGFTTRGSSFALTQGATGPVIHLEARQSKVPGSWATDFFSRRLCKDAKKKLQATHQEIPGLDTTSKTRIPAVFLTGGSLGVGNSRRCRPLTTYDPNVTVGSTRIVNADLRP